MIHLQVISKILNTGNFDIIVNNAIDSSFFKNYEKEFKFIKEHYDTYNKVPDATTFLATFPEFTYIKDVKETDAYLLDKLRETKLFDTILPDLQRVSELMEDGATNKAVQYLNEKLKTININYNLGGMNIISNASKRYEDLIDKSKNQSNWFFSSGFPELDKYIRGIQRKEELVILFARINQGKSWILEKICTSVWEQGYNVGYISPEMTAETVGYRFDTLHKNFSNRNLMWGEVDNNLENDYKKYLNKLESNNSNSFMVATPLDFQNEITISKLRNWIKENKLDFIAIDGVSYLRDERAKRGDNKTTSLTNICEDLMSLSIELNIPIVGVVQANRGGVDGEDGQNNLSLDKIRESDGIAALSSKVISVRQINGVLELTIVKNRVGPVGNTVKYLWDINLGKFTWVPDSKEDNSEETQLAIEANKKIYEDDIESVF